MEIKRSKSGKIVNFVLSEEEYRQMNDDYIGLCLNCGAERDCCEPDAHNYDCPSCQQNRVWGLENLVLAEKISFSDIQTP